ncbi:MAG: hypothetical protein M3M97_01475 [Actinomycetota bacterium]|nr:hypothetical protein [Actinomycetota bacterium]
MKRSRGEDISGLVEVLQEESEAVRCALRDMTGWHRDYNPPAWRHWATDDQKCIGWEIAVRVEQILCTVLYEVHNRQVEDMMDTLSEWPEGFYG